MTRSNIFTHEQLKPSDELIQVLLQTSGFRFERIVSNGSQTADGTWYDQTTDEWVVLLKGRARLRFEDTDEAVELSPGDYLEIPRHRRHRVEWTTPGEQTVWLAVHYPLRCLYQGE